WCRAYHADVSTLELENVLRYLREYSLIDGSQENFYHVHPLVQQMTLYYLDKKNPSCKQELTSQLLNTLFTLTKKYRAKTPETYHFTGSLIPLCTHYFKQEGRWNHPMEALALLLVKTNYHIDVEKNYSEAENCLALANEIAGDLDLPLKGRVGFLNGFVDYVKAKECSDPSVRTALFGSAHQHFQRALEIYDQYIDEELYLHIESNSKKCNRNHQKAICLEYQAQLLIELDRLDEAKQALENSLRELLAICPSGKHYDIARILREEGIILMKRENYLRLLKK
ncbi:MAG: hypothetical protein KDK72_10300, partial [Chlamydiia bacterium]|nr:hypothetical protein [Chlamydiia bacterium]